MLQEASRDTIRICIATDNHLGVRHDDDLLCNDSFIVFEEILKIAKKNKVDFLLLAGDLFDQNKPSQETLHKASTLFRKYCFGDDPVKIDVLPNYREKNFISNGGRLNYEDPNYNISLPVFGIHGNHDDPSGPNSLSPMDMLAVNNLVNYFGKTPKVDSVTLYPTLIRKGETKLALYGLGYIRDERYYQLANHKRLKFIKVNDDSWFSLFTTHQNRHREFLGNKNVVSEDRLPSFLDVVVWGHEHRCQVEPEASTGGFDVIQPGSSVVVGLRPEESKDKKICIIDINGKNYSHTPITLKCRRPFIYERVSLAEILGDEIDRRDTKEITRVLEEKVEFMIEEANAKLPPQEIINRYPSSKLDLPLIKLVVDYSPDFETIAPQRFSQKFSDRVANCKDLLTFSRRNVKKKNDGMQSVMEDAEFHSEVETLESMLKSYLADNNVNLKVLHEDELLRSLDDFVEGKGNKSIENTVKRQLNFIQERLSRDFKDIVADEDTIFEKIYMYNEEYNIQTKAKQNGVSNSNQNLIRTSFNNSELNNSDHMMDESEDSSTSKSHSKRKRNISDDSKSRKRKKVTVSEKIKAFGFEDLSDDGEMKKRPRSNLNVSQWGKRLT